ncbi:MAG: flagellar biosynthesis regulator FlaF [Hyphomicrobiaceae bacterium]
MYRLAYSEVASDGLKEHRYSEREVLLKSISMMERAEQQGIKSLETIEATHFVARLWCHLIDDLGGADNSLAIELRAQLISIGLFMIKTADEIRNGKQKSFRSMIEITASIAEGLKG